MTIEQMSRWYEAAKELKRTEGQSRVAKLLGESPQALANWEEREIPPRGLILAENVIGCSAQLVRDGTVVTLAAKADLSSFVELVALFAKANEGDRQTIFELAHRPVQ